MNARLCEYEIVKSQKCKVKSLMLIYIIFLLCFLRKQDKEFFMTLLREGAYNFH